MNEGACDDIHARAKTPELMDRLGKYEYVLSSTAGPDGLSPYLSSMVYILFTDHNPPLATYVSRTPPSYPSPCTPTRGQ